MEQQSKTLGYLRTCMDRRFVTKIREAWERETGLGPTDYWHESYPGGAALPTDNTGVNYAKDHGVTAWGWAAHGSGCGGQPGIDDGEIQKRLDAVIQEHQGNLPGDHYRIFSTADGTTIQKILR